MQLIEKLQGENDALRERLSRMGSAFLRVNESLDLKTVLHGVVDSARSLTDAKYGLLSVTEDGRRIHNCIPSGLTRRQTRQLWRAPENEALFDHFAFVDKPLRLRDMHSHARRLGLPGFHPAMPVSPKLTCLVAPIFNREERVGTFFLAEKEAGGAFTADDEATIVMFAAQAALAITNARRHQDERLHAEFLAMVSHELRAPLAAITGSATTALRDTFPYRQAEMVQFLRIINEHAERMGVLIDDLLDVARVETGTFVVEPVPVNVTRLLDKARSTLLSARNRDNIQIEHKSGLPPVMADPGRITQVLVNLLANAARNSPDPSPILLTALQEGDDLTICVTDKGRGLSPERLPHMFRRFSRRDIDTYSDCDVQSGLGLSICRGIVEAHGGRIWAESDGEGTGSRFKFTIPIAEGVVDVDAGLTGVATAGSRMPARGRTKILAVDDDPQTLRSIRQALSGAGFVPVVTGEPDEALQLVDEHTPELVLLDLVLPGSDGIELMQKIVERADVPVIFLSAYGHEDAIVRAFDNGAADYVVKPFSPSELTARIRATLRSRTVPGQVVPSEPFMMGDLKFDYARRRVTVAGTPVKLTRIEYALLQELSVHAGRTVPHGDLLKSVWGRQNPDDNRTVHAAVKNIRRKLGDSAKSPTYIFNESGVGYRLGAAV